MVNQDWDQLLFSNPAQAVQRIKAEAVAEARQVLHRDYAITTNRQRWEKLFYGAYPSMAAHKEVVEAKMVEVCQEMPNVTVEQGNLVIAERVEAHIKHRERFASADRERAAYSGGPGFSGAQSATPMHQGGSLGDTISARREQRSDAFAGRKNGRKMRA